MMLGYKKLGGWILGAAALLALLPASADAQFVRYSPIFWSFEGRGGVAIPVGDLGDVQDAGATVGAGLAYFLNPRFALRLDGNVDFFDGKDAGGPDAGSTPPDLTAFRWLGGFEVHVTNPSTSRALLTLGASLGGITLDGDDFTVNNFDGTTNTPLQGATTTTALDDTFFLFNGSVRLGVHASKIVDLFIGGQINIAFLDDEDTAALAHFFGISSFDTGVIFPIEGGIRINVP